MSPRQKKKIERFPVGAIYTTCDGNTPESEVAIVRIAEKYVPGMDIGDQYRSYEHEEFQLCIQTPNNDADPDNDFPNNLQTLKLSRDNMIGLKALLNGIDFESEELTYELEW